MRTLNCTLGLLLCFYCCTAMPSALKQISPSVCCFQFFTKQVPFQKIVSITETHERCQEKAFVVRTARGIQICVGHNAGWAQQAFQRQQQVTLG